MRTGVRHRRTQFFVTIFFDVAPDGGWFMYPPLTGTEYSPGIRTDFWLLGIGFIEISAIAGAIEIVVGILRTRPPGMTLSRMPIYVWAMLVVGGMIIFAFPAVIAATALLELERAFDWPFFIAAREGDPVLWQHLFWLFGHPDVYIIFLPAAGMVSMMVATLAGRELVGYRWVVASLIATGTVSFALWAHHMFSVGMSPASTLFFSRQSHRGGPRGRAGCSPGSPPSRAAPCGAPHRPGFCSGSSAYSFSAA